MNRDTLAQLMRQRSLRGETSIPNPITGRQSENVEVVEGDQSLPDEAQQAAMDAYMNGLNVAYMGVGPTDTRSLGLQTQQTPGGLQQWRPSKARNPGPGGADFMRTMQTSPSPGWMPEGPSPDSSRFDFEAPVGPWSEEYPASYGRGAGFRPGYNLGVKK